MHCVQELMEYAQESEFLKSCVKRTSFNVAKMANDSIIVTSKNMLCLREGESIDSEVIDCHLQILEDQYNARVDDSNRRILTVQCTFSGTFVPAHGLAFEDHYFEQTWKLHSYMWKGVNFLSVDKVYIPWYTKSTTHWSLVVVNKLQCRFEYYNSWLADPKKEPEYSGMILFFWKFLAWQWKQKGIGGLLERSKIKPTSGWDWFIPKPTLKAVGKLLADEIPGQSKMCDCGVLTCMYVKYLSLGRAWDFTYKDVPKFRLMMVRDICRTPLSNGVTTDVQPPG
jgi:Ulp1 family protease